MTQATNFESNIVPPKKKRRTPEEIEEAKRAPRKLRRTALEKSQSIIEGFGAPDRETAEADRLKLLESQAQRGRERLGRVFAIDPGGLRSGGGQRKFELFEADVADKRSQALIDLEQERSARAIANLSALTGVQTTLSGIEVAERGVSVQESAQDEIERAALVREQQLGRELTEQERAALVSEAIAERGAEVAERGATVAEDVVSGVVGKTGEDTLANAIRKGQEFLEKARISGTIDDTDTEAKRSALIAEGFTSSQISGILESGEDTEAARSAKAQEGIAGRELTEIERAAKITEDRLLAELTGIAGDTGPISLSVSLLDTFGIDPSTIKGNIDATLKAGELVASTFEDKFGRPPTEQEVQSIVSGDSINVTVESGRATLDQQRLDEQVRSALIQEGFAEAAVTGFFKDKETEQRRATLREEGFTEAQITGFLDEEATEARRAALAAEGFTEAEITGFLYEEATEARRSRLSEEGFTEAEITGLFKDEDTEKKRAALVAEGFTEAQITGFLDDQATEAREARLSEDKRREAELTGEFDGKSTISQQQLNLQSSAQFGTGPVSISLFKDFGIDPSTIAGDIDASFRAGQTINSTFESKFGRPATESEVRALLRGEPVTVIQQTEAGRQFDANLLEREEQFDDDLEARENELAAQLGISADELEERIRQFNAGTTGAISVSVSLLNDFGIDPSSIEGNIDATFRAGEVIASTFEEKFGRPPTEEEVQSILRGEPVEVTSQTESSKQFEEEIRRFNATTLQQASEFQKQNLNDLFQLSLNEKLTDTENAIRIAQETGSFTDPISGDSVETLQSRKFHLDRQRVIAAETGSIATSVSLLEDFNIDPSEFMNPDGTSNNLGRFFEVADTLASNFEILYGRNPTGMEITQLMQGESIDVMTPTLAGRRMDLDEGIQEFTKTLETAESKGFWVVKRMDGRTFEAPTLSSILASDADEIEKSRVQLGFDDLAERGRQFDQNRLEDIRQFNAADITRQNEIDQRATTAAEALGLDRDQFLQAVREFRTGATGLVEGTSINANSLGVDISKVRNASGFLIPEEVDKATRSLQAISPGITQQQIDNLLAGHDITVSSIQSLQSRALEQSAKEFDNSLEQRDREFFEGIELDREQFEDAREQFDIGIEARADEYASRLGLDRDAFLQGVREFRAGTLGILEGGIVSAESLNIDLTQEDADGDIFTRKIIEDIKSAAPGATDAEVQDILSGQTVTLAGAAPTQETRRLAELARQFDEEIKMRSLENTTRLTDISTNATIEANRLGMEDRELKQAWGGFSIEMRQRMKEFSKTNGLNSAQSAATIADIEGRLQLSQDSLEQEIIEFAARNQLDLAQLTGQTAIGGVITADELGLPLGVVELAPGVVDFDVMGPRIATLQDAFKVATGQEISSQDALAMLGGEGQEVEGLPTLAAKSLAATITAQQMDRAADLSKFAREYGLDHLAFKRASLESDRAFEEISATVSAEHGLDAKKFKQAVTAFNAQDANAKSILRMDLSQLTGKLTEGGQLNAADFGVTREGLYVDGKFDRDIFNEKKAQLQESFFLGTGRELSSNEAARMISNVSYSISVDELPTFAARQVAAQFGIDETKFIEAKRQFDVNFKEKQDSISFAEGLEQEAHDQAWKANKVNEERRVSLNTQIEERIASGTNLSNDEIAALLGIINGGSMAFAPPRAGFWENAATISMAIAGTIAGPSGTTIGDRAESWLFGGPPGPGEG